MRIKTESLQEFLNKHLLDGFDQRDVHQNLMNPVDSLKDKMFLRKEAFEEKIDLIIEVEDVGVKTKFPVNIIYRYTLVEHDSLSVVALLTDKYTEMMSKYTGVDFSRNDSDETVETYSSKANK